MAKIYKRNIQQKLEEAIGRSPVVLLTGARQTGKTTLVKEMGKEKGYGYVTFDDVQIFSAAKDNPVGFIKELPKPIILDEVQRIPELFLTIKKDVDENRIAGRYILTGSANPLLIPRLGDSLAGRMEIYSLLPLSQGEKRGIKELFIEKVFAKDTIFGETYKAHLSQASERSKEQLYKEILIGGYPLVQGVDYSGRDAWFSSYITTLLHRDVQDLSNVTGLTEFPKLLHVLATRVGGLLNTAELSRATGIPATTLARYLSILQILFIVLYQQPWFSNLGKRLLKAPKLFLIDTGLLTSLLKIDVDRALADGNLMGNIFENFIMDELRKQLTWSTKSATLYYLRTTSGIEVDGILEDPSGGIVGIEIKASETITPHDFKGLRYLQEEVGSKFVRGIVIYTGSAYVPFGDRLLAIPAHALWST